MSNGDAFKLVRDFQSSAQQGQGDFSLVYADLLQMSNDSSNPQQLTRELWQANSQLVQDGAIATQNGLPEFVIVGADSQGHIITADPQTQTLQVRGLDMQLSGGGPADADNPNFDATVSSNQNAPGDSGQTNNAPNGQPSAAGNDGASSNQDTGRPAAPEVENWDGRNFTVNADGSAQYTVVSGDTVSAVSDDVLHHRLGQAPSQQQIMNEVGVIASASALANANLIYPGNILVIPAANGDYVPVDNTAGNQPDNSAASQSVNPSQNPLATTYSGAPTPAGNIDGDAQADLGQKMWTNFSGTDNGELGCAASVSEVLQQAQYPYASSAGVYELQQQLTSNGWTQTSQPQPGDVVCGYRTNPSDSGGAGAHAGIVGANGTVYNNSSDTGTWSQTALSDFNSSEYPSGVFYFQPPSRSA